MFPKMYNQPTETPVLRLHVIQAKYGDCLLLEYEAGGTTRHILIDGGPDGVYADHLRYKLEEVAAHHNRLEAVVLTHIDEDHVVGLVDMLSEIAKARSRGEKPLIEVNELWYNTFRPMESGAYGSSDVVEAFSTYLSSAFTGGEMHSAAYSITQGEDLWKASYILNIPLNTTFPSRTITLEEAPRPVDLGELKLWVIGPAQSNLRRYKRKWDEWYDKHKNDPFSTAAADEAHKIDTSVANLSSIMFLAETPDRRILLTGDGKCDDVLAGLKQTGRLDPGGTLHVDVLKVPHHGSARNNSRKFFQKVTARQYVIPAGKHKNDGNPDLQTLVWIVESAKKRGEQIDILVTNPNDSTTALQQRYPAAKYGYKLTFFAPDQHFIVL
ncbi:MAG: MBL fold metallo-hydrolase [Anaerolineales bacterium]|nr:MBL fold metallo-hydrolase [Anaerolineales bacterium]